VTGPRISVALSTWNGATWLSEQLASIAGQTRPPDELVVRDDGSGDETPAILDGFAAQASFPVRIERGQDNLGSTRSFERAIAACTGDVIALCDQDDVWRPDKLVRLAEPFAAPEVGLVFSDAEVVDERLEPLGGRLWPRVGFGPLKRRQVRRGHAFEVLLKSNVVYGVTMAFRNRLVDGLLPVPAGWWHDGWIALLTAAMAEVAIVDLPLVAYRQHPASQTGSVTAGLAEQVAARYARAVDDYRREVERWRQAQQHLAVLAARGAVDPARLARLQAKLRHLETRTGLPDPSVRRWPRVAGELVSLRYYRYSPSWKSVAKDLLAGASTT
jgi:glycosyltransferase involved in cell wall biosynthesis